MHINIYILYTHTQYGLWIKQSVAVYIQANSDETRAESNLLPAHTAANTTVRKTSGSMKDSLTDRLFGK